MPGERWYVTGLILCFLVLSLTMLGFRWSVLASRVPLQPLSGDLDARPLPVPAAQPVAQAEMAAAETPAQPGATAKLNLNKATAEELVALPGIGPVLAGRIVAHREVHGAFAEVDELLDVEGIGEGKLEDVREYICAEPAD